MKTLGAGKTGVVAASANRLGRPPPPAHTRSVQNLQTSHLILTPMIATYIAIFIATANTKMENAAITAICIGEDSRINS